MRVVLLAALATTALTSGALSTEAFVGQIGRGNEGFNVQLNQDPGSTSTAVIFQSNDGTSGGLNGHDALQVQIGNNNDAYTYQNSNYYDHVALTWQEGTGNDAVTVQATAEVVPPDGSLNNYTSRIIQDGTGNSALNWQSDTASSGIVTLGVLSITPPSPTIDVSGPTVGVNNVNPVIVPNNWNLAPPVDFGG